MGKATGLRAKSLDRLRREELLRIRVAEIVDAERMVPFRVGEAIDFRPARHFVTWLRGKITIGPSQIERINAWLEKWDAAEVEIAPLQMNGQQTGKPLPRDNTETDDRTPT